MQDRLERYLGSVFLSNANGTLQPRIHVNAGFSMESVAAADFDGDGKVDMAASGQLTTSFLFGVAFLRGKGDGTFQAPVNVETDFGPSSLVARDFNGDGWMDLMVANCCGMTEMTQLLGHGDFTFSLNQLPGGADPIRVVSADFDKDGKDDLAIVNSPTGLGVRSSVLVLMNSLPSMLNVSAASSQYGTVAPDSIISAYGGRLANQVAAASSPDWPETLGGTSVKVLEPSGPDASPLLRRTR